MFGLGKRQTKDVFGRKAQERPAAPAAPAPSLPVTALSPFGYSYDDGEKFYGGFGTTQLLFTDYWSLRARSAQLYETNHYARGLIRRLVTNEINTGLHLEATPEEKILGYAEDELAELSEDVENRWFLWAKDPFLCDFYERQTFGALQSTARAEALLEGDILVTLQQHPLTALPRVRLIPGSCIQTPLSTPRGGNKIVHGVEIDSLGRHVAFWVRQENGSAKRLPAFGEKTGRRLAWLVYGSDKRLDEVRGKPLLSLVLQSLKEIDRYRDSTQRKAVLLAMLAMFVKKGEERPGTRPMSGGAVRRTTIQTSADGSGAERSFRTADHIPGLILDELQFGEEPVAFQSNGTVESFGTFEEAIIQSIAWSHEIPPEILKLAFGTNYSASQAAINEFKTYLNRVRTAWGDTFCAPCYQEWLISESLNQTIDIPGLLEAWRDPKQYTTWNAWVSSDWSGNIKPAVDLTKLVTGYTALVEQGFITRDRAARELTGTKFSKNAQKLRLENEMLAEANEPLAKLEAPATDAINSAPEPIEQDDSTDEEDQKAAS